VGANKVLLSLLLNWQIMEIRHSDPVGWVNRVVRRNPQIFLRAVTHRTLSELPLQGRSLGQYLLDDCRDAIAHIRRKPGRRALRFDDEEENGRLWRSAEVTKELARHYIRAELGVTELLHLVRPRRGGFPRYVDEATIQQGGYRSVR
jgi:methylamine utilization protein MauJ